MLRLLKTQPSHSCTQSTSLSVMKASLACSPLLFCELSSAALVELPFYSKEGTKTLDLYITEVGKYSFSVQVKGRIMDGLLFANVLTGVDNRTLPGLCICTFDLNTRLHAYQPLQNPSSE